MEQDPLGTPKIIYEDDRIIGVFKPNRLLVHRTNIDFYEKQNLLQWLSDAVKTTVHPAHRLDKATSGIVLFTKDLDALRFLRQQFSERTLAKSYLALVRGYTAASGRIEKPLQKEGDSTLREAITNYITLSHTELPIAVSRYETSRYSLLRAFPETGRYHQIRLHFAHLRHPIIGDSRHGDKKHNQMFREVQQLPALFLHAENIEFTHPAGRQITLHAPVPDHFQAVLSNFNWTAGAHASTEKNEAES
jgi:tRNA pseudouridine65 synthase